MDSQYTSHSLFTLPLQTDKGYDRSTFDKQMAVMRGQVRLCSLCMARMPSISELAYIGCNRCKSFKLVYASSDILVEFLVLFSVSFCLSCRS